MAPFAGYEMPFNYPLGVLKEHLWTREHAGFFDISHMGQAWIIADTQQTVCKALEELIPADLLELEKGRQVYTQLLNDSAGIIDDLIVTKPAENHYNNRLYLVVNASRKDHDYTIIAEKLNNKIKVHRLEDRTLIALQGPESCQCLNRLIPGIDHLRFFTFKEFLWKNVPLWIARCGYTGEDGFEISLPNQEALQFSHALLDMAEVQPIGLAARNSLRLEAGLCLYGSDMNEEKTPVEASLLWSLGKRRREQGGFAGAHIIADQIKNPPKIKRIGLDIQGKSLCREGTEIFFNHEPVGIITSGGFGPSLAKPIAMGYIQHHLSALGTAVELRVRDKYVPAKICPLPYVSPKYVR